MTRFEIKDSRNFLMGWGEDDVHEVRYYGVKTGYIGRFDRSSGRYVYMSGSRVGQWGPACDIGPSEVLRAEGSR